MRELPPRDVAALLEQSPPPVLLDVREPWELAAAALPGASHIPMGDIPDRLHELEPARTTVVICHHGRRSARVADYLERNGFTDVINLAGGIDAWSETVDPAVPRY
jgi:rhodanese-related sulfurtransferase